jgi:hypothetical protein
VSIAGRRRAGRGRARCQCVCMCASFTAGSLQQK